MNSYSFSEIAHEFQATYDWLNSLGLKLQNTRIARYRKCLNHIADLDDSGLSKVTQTEDITYRQVLYEISEFIFLYRVFEKSQPAGFLKKAQIICKGKDAYSLEDSRSNTHARDIAFELLVAARLEYSGLHPILDLTDDVAWKTQYSTVSIQCKRCKTMSSISRNLKRASKQIDNDIQDTNLQVDSGIIALDITAALNPSLKPYTSKTVKGLLQQIDYGIDSTISQYLDDDTSRISSSINSVLVHFSTLGHVVTTTEPLYMQNYFQWDVHSNSVTKQLSSALEKGNRSSGFEEMVK